MRRVNVGTTPDAPHPGIDEYDTGSWLDASITEHDVLGVAPWGLVLNPSASFRSASEHPGRLNMWNGSTLCRRCAFFGARRFGYTGPEEFRISYLARSRPPEREWCMVLREGDRIVSVATYSYGRCYFEPGEPRTDPCEVCGRETLICASGHCG